MPHRVSIHDNALDRPWGDSPRSRFNSFVAAVAAADTPLDRRRDPRLRHSTLSAVAGSSGTIGAEGGFLLPEPVAVDFAEVLFDASQLFPRCADIRTGATSSVEIRILDDGNRADAARFGGVAVHHVAEGAEIGVSHPKFRKVDLKLEKLAAVMPVTSELDEDARPSLETLAFRGVAEEIAGTVDRDILAGSGAGCALGYLNSTACIEVDKEAGQANETVVFENLTKMAKRLPAACYRRSVWVTGLDTLPALLSVAAPGGAPLAGVGAWATAEPAAGATLVLLGRPVVFVENAPALGSAGDLSLADLRWFGAVTKAGLAAAIAESIHVRFVYHEKLIRFVLGFNGAPLLAGPVSPLVGTDTLSPFAKLGARSA